LEFYAENGPSGLGRYRLPRITEGHFGLEGWIVMMVGNSVPYRGRHAATKEERMIWSRRRADFAARAQQGFDVKQTLAYVRDPRWQWNAAAATARNVPVAPIERDATFKPTRSFAFA
jgi:tryptophan halogenase